MALIFSTLISSATTGLQEFKLLLQGMAHVALDEVHDLFSPLSTASTTAHNRAAICLQPDCTPTMQVQSALCSNNLLSAFIQDHPWSIRVSTCFSLWFNLPMHKAVIYVWADFMVLKVCNMARQVQSFPKS